jgi:hypothetical protein
MTGVLQTWVAECPLREQGVLVLALRGPDGVRKEHGAKNIVRALRGCVMVTGATGQPLMPGFDLPDDSFMQMYRIGHTDEAPWQEACIEFFRSWDEFNVHFLLHLTHACEVLGIRHPEMRVRNRWYELYLRIVKKSHLNPESVDQMIDRLKDGHKPDAPD